MRIAESLYMSGFISYPRVDNTVYPKTLDIEGIVKGPVSYTHLGFARACRRPGLEGAQFVPDPI